MSSTLHLHCRVRWNERAPGWRTREGQDGTREQKSVQTAKGARPGYMSWRRDGKTFPELTQTLKTRSSWNEIESDFDLIKQLLYIPKRLGGDFKGEKKISSEVFSLLGPFSAYTQDIILITFHQRARFKDPQLHAYPAADAFNSFNPPYPPSKYEVFSLQNLL